MAASKDKLPVCKQKMKDCFARQGDCCRILSCTDFRKKNARFINGIMKKPSKSKGVST
mgnify:CR=1 FL=1